MLVNVIISKGMPSSYKHATVTPLLKKPSLDPVSNLTFLSKTIERVVASRLTLYLESNQLMDPHQCAYRRGHSCEFALVRVLNDCFCSIDRGEVTVLVLLDLSSAFDTVDHSILIESLASLEIVSDALLWFSHYLKDCSQSVMVGSAVSPPVHLLFGVPQGSVLGPLLFAVYMIGIGPIVQQFGVKNKLYADDLQLHISTTPALLEQAILRLEECISAVRQWLSLECCS